MDPATPNKPRPSAQRLLGTRRGSVVVALGAALLASVGLIAYLSHYRDEVRGGAVPAQVLVADRVIPKGTSGSTIASGRFFKVVTVTADDLEPQALKDATTLDGAQFTDREIAPGEQLTAGAFSDSGDPVRGQLSGVQRGVAIPLDRARGIVGTVHPGDHVDVIGTLSQGGLARVIVQDGLVLKAPSSQPDSATDTEPVIVRMSDQEAVSVADFSDHGEIWITLRPTAGADESSRPELSNGVSK
jgi:Flp pilus assembly protein CpaB